jgi:chloramphenicol-sensitive protein RarD
VLAVGAGKGLWISLSLALSFGLYGFVRKVAPVESLEGLSIETLLLAPVALGFLLVAGPGGGAVLDGGSWGLLALSGAVTATPLLLFASAARRLPYSTLGFLQYIAPTIQFLMAVLVFGEHLTRSHIICFACIWTALAIFAVDGVRRGRAARADPVPD